MVEDAVNAWLVMVQLKTTGLAIATFGTALVSITVAEAIAVQPLDGSVTVTV